MATIKNEKTKAELDEAARALNIEGRSSMSKDELEKAIDKAGKDGVTSNVVTPREGQGSDKGVAYLEEGEERDLSGQGGEVAPAEREGGSADQSSLGGTITGPNTDTGAPARPNPNP